MKAYSHLNQEPIHEAKQTNTEKSVNICKCCISQCCCKTNSPKKISVATKHTSTSRSRYTSWLSVLPVSYLPALRYHSSPVGWPHRERQEARPGSRIALGFVHGWRTSHSTDKVSHVAKAKEHGEGGCSSCRSRKSHAMAEHVTLSRGGG